MIILYGYESFIYNVIIEHNLIARAIKAGHSWSALAGLLMEDIAPLMHITADTIKEKESLYGVDHRRVGNLCLLCQEWCQSFDGDSSWWPHSTARGHDKGCICPMLNINYSLFIFPPFVHFMLAVAWGHRGRAIWWGMGVEYLHIEESCCLWYVPEITGTHIEPCIVFYRGWMELKVFTTERLEYRFHCNTWVNFSEHFCKQVPDLVVPDDREGPLWATKCVINVEGDSVGTVWWGTSEGHLYTPIHCWGVYTLIHCWDTYVHTNTLLRYVHYNTVGSG